MFRPLSTISLPSTAQILLRENGFMYCEDIVNHRGVSPEARKILEKWNLHSNECWHNLTNPPQAISCLDLWQEESTSPRIVSWSKEVDSMLGGGVHLQAITELCGAPGSGKTQICLQLCIDVQIPKSLGGAEGEAVFIDTASNFTPQRLRDLADAYCKHCGLLSKASVDSTSDKLKKLQSDDVMKGIHVVSAHGVSQLLAAVKLLPKVLEQHPKVKLIVIDSLAFPFNCGEACSTIDRTRFIYQIFSDLQQLAAQKGLAVVVTNQLTTRLIKAPGSHSELSPALGESMGHRVNQRILLGHVLGNIMAAVLLKGNSYCSSSAKFKITKAGIRDL